jgi:hypothetical protein
MGDPDPQEAPAHTPLLVLNLEDRVVESPRQFLDIYSVPARGEDASHYRIVTSPGGTETRIWNAETGELLHRLDAGRGHALATYASVTGEPRIVLSAFEG